jgi:phage/plasmid primase-like uncharacterized protein
MSRAALQALIEQARSVSIETEVERRGLKLKGKIERVGPCPKCSGHDRFAINIHKQIWHCRGCKPTRITGDVIGLVMWLDGRTFREAVELLTDDARPRPTAAVCEQTDNDEAGRITAALRWWHEAGPVEGTIGTTYFEREREIFELPPDVHEVLRFHRRCVWGRDDDGRWTFHPCILALYRDIISDEPTGVHRIALDSDGKLIDRMGLGRKRKSAVKLWGEAEMTTGLVVGEGVETVLAAATRVRHRGTLLQPAWSLVDAGNLERLPIIPGIEHLTVLADADESQRGQDAARTCARRWAQAGRQVAVLIPNQIGDDFNDIARGEKRQARS